MAPSRKWLLILPQLPASPSTLRVTVWRRMREAGALGLQNGVWLLPDQPAHRKLATELADYLKDHRADCLSFPVASPGQAVEKNVVKRWQAERDEEYTEFIERCEVLLEDLKQETKKGRFSFAELEEAEVDLNKLDEWWVKCTQRDFVTGSRRTEAKNKLESCRSKFKLFASRVYAKQAENTGTNHD